MRSIGISAKRTAVAAAERTQREKVNGRPVLVVGESHDSSHDSLRRPSTTRHSKLLSCLNG